MFPILLDASSILWKRIYEPYFHDPWILLQLLSAKVSSRHKLELLARLRGSRECDLNPDFTVPFFRMFAGIPDQELLKNKLFISVLVVLARNKDTNVEVENNFARASSSRQYLRGCIQDLTTMISKHVISEVRHQHVVSMLRENTKMPNETDMPQDLANLHTLHVGDGAVDLPGNIRAPLVPALTDSEPLLRRQTCHTLAIRDLHSTQPIMQGESKARRQRRIHEEATDYVRDPFNILAVTQLKRQAGLRNVR
jgi:hypothetical protein